jgi:hypothetical protein
MTQLFSNGPKLSQKNAVDRRLTSTADCPYVNTTLGGINMNIWQRRAAAARRRYAVRALETALIVAGHDAIIRWHHTISRADPRSIQVIAADRAPAPARPRAKRGAFGRTSPRLRSTASSAPIRFSQAAISVGSNVGGS